MSALLLLQLLACASMTAVIWLVQILIYPNFRFIPRSSFKEFHEFHSRRITWIVAPAMLTELATGVALLYLKTQTAYALNLVSILVTWLLTMFVSVPIHNALGTQLQNAKLIEKLIWTNWFRTTAWTIRILSLLWFFHENQ